MKLCVLMLAILYLANARTLQNGDNEKHRHRRRSRDPFYRYDYDRNYFDRIDYDRDDSITEIKHLLQEISSYVKRPPPPANPPQTIVYVPYPVPYNIINKPCKPDISIHDRFEVKDENTIWGIYYPSNKGSKIESEGDGSRPISLDPIEPPDQIPEMPSVEHGSHQAGMTTTTTPPPTESTPALKSRICQAAILICCDYKEEEEIKQCFYRYDCLRTYYTGLSCSKTVIDKAIDEFTSVYGPIR